MEIAFNVLGFIALLVWITNPIWISQWGDDTESLRKRIAYRDNDALRRVEKSPAVLDAIKSQESANHLYSKAKPQPHQHKE